MRNGIIKGIVALFVAAALVVTAGIGSSWFTNPNIATWFNGWGKNKEGGDSGDTQYPNIIDNGGLSVSEITESGIAVLSAKLPVEAFAANGISARAENAYVLTAEVGDDDYAENTAVVWSSAWQNPQSAWAQGKQVSDYVTVTPSGTSYMATKVATLVGLQPFAEPIVVTVSAKEKPEVMTTCLLDYAQRVTDFSLSFGNVDCNFDDITYVVVDLLENYNIRYGGDTNLRLQKNDVYTLEAKTSVNYSLTLDDLIRDDNCVNFGEYAEASTRKVWANAFSTGYGYSVKAEFDESALARYDVENKGLLFSLESFIASVGLSITSTYGNVSRPCSTFDLLNMFKAYSVLADESFGGDYYEDYGEVFAKGLTDIFRLNVTVEIETAKETTQLYKTTTFRMSGYICDGVISSVDLNYGHIVL